MFSVEEIIYCVSNRIIMHFKITNCSYVHCTDSAVSHVTCFTMTLPHPPSTELEAEFLVLGFCNGRSYQIQGSFGRQRRSRAHAWVPPRSWRRTRTCCPRTGRPPAGGAEWSLCNPSGPTLPSPGTSLCTAILYDSRQRLTDIPPSNCPAAMWTYSLSLPHTYRNYCIWWNPWCWISTVLHNTRTLKLF